MSFQCIGEHIVPEWWISMYFEDGKIVMDIGSLTAEFEEDIHDVIGVWRCMSITIESDASDRVV